MEGDEGRKGKEALSGGHLCHVCGYQYPNANPSAKLRRSHRKNCGKAPAAGEREEEEADGAVERNAGEGLLPVRGGGGGESEGNAGSPSLGSARGDADLVEVKEIAEHASPNVTGVQVITGYCSEAGVINCTSQSDEITKEVGRPAEREDSLDEYQDASPFLHQPDSEVGAAVAHKSDFSIEEIKNLDSVSLGASVAANEISVEMDGVWKNQSSGQPNMTDLSSNEISVEMDGVWKDQSSGQPNMTDLSVESIVGKEVGCYSDNRTPGLAEPTVMLESSDGSSVNVHSDNTDIDSKADKTSDYSEFIGDVNGSTSLISDLTCQSTSPRMVESLMEDSMDALHIISEISPSLEEKAGSANAESETENSRIDFVQTEDQLKLTNAVNTLTNCSSQNKCVEDTLDVQLPVENPFLGNSVCSLDGHQSDHVVTNMDSMWGSDDEGICSEGIKAKGSELGFSCEENPQHVEQLVDKADENPSVEKPNGLSEEVVCSKEIGPEVPTIGQVSASQEHVALLMGQVSTKNPFILDDTRSDDLFELPTENYHSEAQNVAESKLQVDFTPLPLDQLIISNQTSNAEGQHVISDDRVPAISSTCGNGPAVGTEDVSVSSTSDPTKNISLHDASVNNSTQEDGERTSGINFVPSEVFLPAEFSTMPTSQDINALKKDGNDKAPLEDISTKDMTASLSEDNVEEKKETEGISVKEMNSILKADNVEEEKLTDDMSAKRNAIQHIDDAEKQAGDTVSRETSALQNIEERETAEDTGAKGVLAVGSMENADAENQTEDTGAKPECKSDNADNKKQSYDTSTEEMNDKNQTPDTCSKETNTVQNTSNVEEKKQTEDLADQEGNKQKEGISPTLTVTKQSSERVHVPLKVLLAEASVETKEKKTTAKERVLSFRRRVTKDDSSSAKTGSPKSGADDNKFWSSPARLPENNAEKKSKARKQPWMPFICCHSVH